MRHIILLMLAACCSAEDSTPIGLGPPPANFTSPVTITSGTINATTVGAITPASGAFTTLTSNGATTFTAGTSSSSYTTGTLVVTGGVGISGALFTNGGAVIGGNVIVGAGGTMTYSEGAGNVLTVGTGTTYGFLGSNGATGNSHGFYIQCGTNNRWSYFTDGVAETGSDTGDGLELGAYADGGGAIDYPIKITRASAGAITLGGTSARSVVLTGVPKFGGTNTTGAGTPLWGTNCPAVTVTAPYTWIRATSSDGSTVYIAAYK